MHKSLNFDAEIRWKSNDVQSWQNLDFCDTSRARIDFHRIQGSRKPIKKHENSIQNRCSKTSENYTKTDPQINEHWSKYQLGADFGFPNLALGGFWSDAKISWIFDALLEAKNRRKLAQGPFLEVLAVNEGLLSGDLGPRGGAFSRASTLYQGTKDKRLLEKGKVGKFEKETRLF